MDNPTVYQSTSLVDPKQYTYVFDVRTVNADRIETLIATLHARLLGADYSIGKDYSYCVNTLYQTVSVTMTDVEFNQLFAKLWTIKYQPSESPLDTIYKKMSVGIPVYRNG